MKTCCKYTRRAPDGTLRERFLADTNTNRSRKFVHIDGEVWTNRCLVVGDPDMTTADHEKIAP